MAEPGHRTDADSQTPPRMPRWVRTTLIVLGVLLALFVVLRLTGVGGEHGPDRHLSGLVAQSAAAASVSGVAPVPTVAWAR